VNVDFDLIGINEEEDNLLDCEKTEGGEVSFKAIFLRRCIAIHQRMQLPRLGKNAIQ
jgi:hypothetical protein